MRNIHTERRKIGLLKGVKIGKKFEEEVIELVDVGMPNLWGHLKNETERHLMR